MSISLRLRPPRLDDEEQFVAAHRALATEGFNFGLNYEPGEPWEAYLHQVAGQRRGGRFDSISTVEDGHAVRRYWID